MLVYRVEDEMGNGPYTTSFFSKRHNLCSEHSNYDHPSPNVCPILDGIIDDEFCGFDSPAAVLNWFEPKWRKALEAESFNVTVYESEGVRVGQRGQALFERDIAETVTRYGFAELVAETKALAR